MRERIKSYNNLLKQRTKLVKNLRCLITETILRGSIRIQGNRCGGSKGCKCKRKDNPILHGPYPYLSFRGQKSNHSLLLTKSKLGCVEKSIANYKEIMKAVIKLSDIDFQIVRYHRDRLKREK